MTHLYVFCIFCKNNLLKTIRRSPIYHLVLSCLLILIPIGISQQYIYVYHNIFLFLSNKSQLYQYFLILLNVTLQRWHKQMRIKLSKKSTITWTTFLGRFGSPYNKRRNVKIWFKIAQGYMAYTNSHCNTLQIIWKKLVINWTT